MRRKIKYTKRYKDYPKNVPKALLKEFFGPYRLSVSMLSAYHEVNTGIISKLLNDGIEPKDNDVRLRLHFKPLTTCPTCGRKIIKHKVSEQKTKQPDYMEKWKKLPTEERRQAIQAYINWQEQNENFAKIVERRARNNHQ